MLLSSDAIEFGDNALRKILDAVAQTRDQCESYYYSYLRKGAQRQGGGALRGDKSRVGM